MENQSENVKKWVKEAKKRKSKGFVDICDTFSYEHYPVYFGGPKDDYKYPSQVLRKYDGRNMQRSYGVFDSKGNEK